MTTALVVLTLNEIDGMKQIMPKIEKTWVDEIVIVDGGSTDGTIDEANKMGLRVVTQKKKGHGGAILEGVEVTNSDNIVFFGPDGNHEPEEIPKLTRDIENEKSDIVVGYRFENETDMPKYRKFGNKLLDRVSNSVSELPFRDPQSGYRAYSKKAINSVLGDDLMIPMFLFSPG